MTGRRRRLSARNASARMSLFVGFMIQSWPQWPDQMPPVGRHRIRSLISLQPQQDLGHIALDRPKIPREGKHALACSQC